MEHIHWSTLRWTEELADALRASAEEDDLPGFVLSQTGDSFAVTTPAGTGTARPSGHMRHLMELGASDVPTVGDFVVAAPIHGAGVTSKAAWGAGAGGRSSGPGGRPPGSDVPEAYRLRSLLPRRNALARRKPGKRPDEQVAAANIDLLAVVTTGGRDFSDRRIERYIETVTGRERPAALAIVNKCDLLDEPEAFVRYAQGLLPTIEVVGISALSGLGIDALRPHFAEGRTVALAGSSGVGKTSIIRALAGTTIEPAALRVGHVRSDERGRHTTTTRKVYALPGAALVIDMPGMREVQVLGDEGGSAAFDDIEALAAECRFRDCRHMREPGCAVKAAVRDGTLTQERFQSYLRLREEGTSNRAELRRRREEWGKSIAKATRRAKKYGKGGR
ncbi:MAG: ribosome small subunit-dependent GTPase A [Spirochaetota bacterium]